MTFHNDAPNNCKTLKLPKAINAFILKLKNKILCRTLEAQYFH